MSVQDDNGNYIVVARRYRPQAFDELIGQAHVAQALTNAIKTNRVGHAYLFTGARGVGKTSAARILAKALNCPNGEPGKPCQECEVCKDIASGEDVDVLEIDGASNRGIDEIRQLRSNVNIRPGRAQYKVYIIDEVHMLTTQAFNALLKTLEEPPEHVKFIFCTTDPEKIPITVLSRCQRFDFASVDSASIRGRLEHICKEENVDADVDALGILARRAAGSMRDSQSLLEQLLSFCGDKLAVDDVQKLLGTADTGRVIQLAQSITDRQPGEAMQAVDAAIHGGVDAGQLTEQLLVCWRDVAAITVGCGDELLQFARPDDVPVLRELGEKCGLETTLSILQILDSTLTKMRLSTHMRTLLEIAIVRAASLQSVESLTTLLSGANSGAVVAPAAVKKKADVTAAVVTPSSATQTTTSSEPNSQSSPSSEVPSSEVPSSLPSQPPPTVAAALETESQTQAASESSVPAQPVQPSAQPTETTQPLVSLTDQNAATIWARVLEDMGDMTAEFASRYQRLAISGPNQLVVTLESAYNKDECERGNRKSRFEETLSRIVGQPTRVQFRVDQQQVAARPKMETKTKRQLIREVEKYPMVADAIARFDGEVVDVNMPRAKPK